MKRFPFASAPWPVCVVAGAVLSACAAGETPAVLDDAQVDTTTDVALDSAPKDTGTEPPSPDVTAPTDAADVGADALYDAATDTREADVSLDAAPDDTPDAVDDIATDVAPDVALDVTRDVPIDTGPDITDAGFDATMDVRADVASDVPFDIATDVGGSLEVPLPSFTVMTSVTRLEQRGFVVASIENTNGTTSEGDRLALRYVERVGHGLVGGAPFYLPITTIAPGSDNPIMLMGSLGPEHFFVVLNLPSFRSTLRLFAWRGGAFVDLGETPLVAGSTFTQTPSFFTGHPVDATRHLLGYRERDSGQPFRYRLIIRAGDTIRFGTPVVRPSTFSGLAAGESQSDPALFRVGPTTFVEARPGYVYPPGDLATWVLDVRADNTLGASGGVTHATVDRTMVPEVAADGRGNALIAYHSYSSTAWQYATYTHAGRDLSERGMLANAGSSGIRAHQGESTDRALGGAWYLRLPGSSRSPVPLHRIDATSLAVTTAAEVPSMWGCYRVPQVVRLGTIAAYAGCDRVAFVDLMPRCGNRTVDTGERCDDGNNLDGDGCSAGCTTE